VIALARPRKVKKIHSSRVICYLRVSTDEQANSGLGLAAQRAKLESECAYRGWSDVEWIEDAGYSAKSLNRPGMQRALELLSSNQARTLVAVKLDRLSRSVLDFTGLLLLAESEGWSLVVLDLGLDMSTPNGKFVAQVMSSVAELERNLIAERTRAALAVKKAQGIRLGSPEHLRIPGEVRDFIVRERAVGSTLQAIADQLNARCVPTARGGAQWWPSTVANVV
jgi:DNA invertase Pin-like site-specific DNA recombinase